MLSYSVLQIKEIGIVCSQWRINFVCFQLTNGIVKFDQTINRFQSLCRYTDLSTRLLPQARHNIGRLQTRHLNTVINNSPMIKEPHNPSQIFNINPSQQTLAIRNRNPLPRLLQMQRNNAVPTLHVLLRGMIRWFPWKEMRHCLPL